VAEKKLPRGVIKEDFRLEKTESEASVALMKHRWHWTLDESNPKRVSLRQYAREIGKAFVVIHKYANGYKLWTDLSGEITPSESMGRASMSAEKEAVTEAVAKAHDLSFEEARKSRGTEIKRIRDWARDRAEEKETSVEEEAPDLAKAAVRTRKGEAKLKADRLNRRGLRYIEAEGDLAAAQRKLTKVLTLAQEVEWDSEEVDLLQDSISKIRALLNLIDLKLAGDAEIDWDAELAKLAD
jgi:hypothetical protein